jgi:hypothetical protein
VKITRLTENESVGDRVGEFNDVTYNRLVKVLGEPEVLGSDKIQVMWVFKYQNYVISIYDWKIDTNIKRNRIWDVASTDENAFLIAVAIVKGKKVFDYIFSGQYFEERKQ